MCAVAAKLLLRLCGMLIFPGYVLERDLVEKEECPEFDTDDLRFRSDPVLHCSFESLRAVEGRDEAGVRVMREQGLVERDVVVEELGERSVDSFILTLRMLL